MKVHMYLLLAELSLLDVRMLVSHQSHRLSMFKQVTFITEKAACPAGTLPQTSKALIHVFKPVATQCIPYQLAPTASSTCLLLEFSTIQAGNPPLTPPLHASPGFYGA
jgi:hypothetical protein